VASDYDSYKTFEIEFENPPSTFCSLFFSPFRRYHPPSVILFPDYLYVIRPKQQQAKTIFLLSEWGVQRSNGHSSLSCHKTGNKSCGRFMVVLGGELIFSFRPPLGFLLSFFCFSSCLSGATTTTPLTKKTNWGATLRIGQDNFVRKWDEVMRERRLQRMRLRDIQEDMEQAVFTGRQARSVFMG
jgi:hypothetical protein